MLRELALLSENASLVILTASLLESETSEIVTSGGSPVEYFFQVLSDSLHQGYRRVDGRTERQTEGRLADAAVVFNNHVIANFPISTECSMCRSMASTRVQGWGDEAPKGMRSERGTAPPKKFFGFVISK